MATITISLSCHRDLIPVHKTDHNANRVKLPFMGLHESSGNGDVQLSCTRLCVYGMWFLPVHHWSSARDLCSSQEVKPFYLCPIYVHRLPHDFLYYFLDYLNVHQHSYTRESKIIKDKPD